MTIGNREFDTENRCYIIGILNVTPDSFSDGGKYLKLDDSLRHAEQMIMAGADIIDVGGESSRPGFTGISASEEIDRVLPVMTAIGSRFDIPLSVDTGKSVVAKAAIAAGADMVNDVWGFRRDPDMAEVVAGSGVACCLMHNREKIDYGDFIQDLLGDLNESVVLAKNAGIAHDKIVLDPGIGFAKTYEMNLEAIDRIDAIKDIGYPVLIGASRKSVVGITLGLPEYERLEGSLAALVIGVVRGCSFARVHDVTESKRAVKMAEAIVKRRMENP